MARTGRPPVPTEIKRKRGTARPDRTPNLGNLAAVPAVDAELHELDPYQVFDTVMQTGKVWLAQTDSIALAMLRESLEERSTLRDIVIKTQSPDARKALRELDKQIHGQLSTLGFDPAARSRLGLAEVKAATKLEQLRQARG